MIFSWQVLARVSVQYEPMLENLVGTLFLSPTGIPALTKASRCFPKPICCLDKLREPSDAEVAVQLVLSQANIDLLQKDNVTHGNPRSQRRVSGRSQRSHRSRSSHSSAGESEGCIPYWYSTLLYKISIYICIYNIYIYQLCSVPFFFL